MKTGVPRRSCGNGSLYSPSRPSLTSRRAPLDRYSTAASHRVNRLGSSNTFNMKGMPQRLNTRVTLALLRTLYDALSSSDFDTVLGLMADDVVGHVPGRSQVAGDYEGKAAVGGYVGKLMELSGGTLRFACHAAVCGDDHGVGLVNDRAERGDAALNMNNVHVWHIRDGLLSEIWVYPGDQYAWDAFWGS